MFGGQKNKRHKKEAEEKPTKKGSKRHRGTEGEDALAQIDEAMESAEQTTQDYMEVRSTGICRCF